ncbi:MAG: O-antigen ligase family protein [Stellaceae bacterium]
MIFVALASVIAAAPLPLGAARPIIWDVMALAVAILLLASLKVSAADMRPLTAAIAVPVLLFLLVIGFVAVQIGSFVPVDWQNSVWEMAGEALPGSVRGSIAVDHGAALVGLLRLLCYGGIFLLSLLLCRARARALAAVRLVAYSGGCYAAYGLVAYGFGNGTVLWLRKWAYPEDLTGTFVNHNSFATYLGLCFLASLAYLVILLERVRFFGTWRDRLGTAVELLSRQPAIVVCIFFLPTALFLTHSRGGFIATLAGSLVFAMGLSQSPSLRRLRRLRIAALPLLLIVFAFLLSADRLVERMVGAGEDAQGRLAIYASTWRAIGDYPIFGTGLGSFAYIYPIYRTPEVWGFVDMGHDDYLQNLLELGAPAALCLFVALAWFIGLCVRGAVIRRRDAVFACLGVAASALVAVHAIVDFSLQIPAVTATYLFLLGAGVAQSFSTRPKELSDRVSGARKAPS